jgi:hypothetical protein
MHHRAKSRVAGAIALILGLAGVAWTWHAATASGSFPAKLSILGPGVVSVGFWLMVEGPELPLRRMSPLGWVFLALGLLAGVVFQQLLKTGRLTFLG